MKRCDLTGLMVAISALSTWTLTASGAVSATMIAPGSFLVQSGGVLDTLYGLSNLRRVDDRFDELWLGDHGTVEAVGAFAGAPQIIGTLDRHGSYRPMFRISGTEFSVSGSGSLGSDIARPFRWTNQAGDSSPVATSRSSDNPFGDDYMVSWEIVRGPKAGGYVLGWEDSISSDRDFEDSVVEVQGVAPIPLPAPFHLIIGSFVALGLFGRYRRSARHPAI